MLVHPSLTATATRRLDIIIWGVVEHLVGYRIPKSREGLDWEFLIDIPVEALSGRSFQC